MSVPSSGMVGMGHQMEASWFGKALQDRFGARDSERKAASFGTPQMATASTAGFSFAHQPKGKTPSSLVEVPHKEAGDSLCAIWAVLPGLSETWRNG